MSRSSGFNILARKAYLSYHQDGLIDILIGWAALAFGLNLATDASAWTLIGWLPIIFYVPLKNRITVPRLGYVNFDSKYGGRARMTAGFLALFGLVILAGGVTFFLLTGSNAPLADWIRENTLLFYGLVGAIGFGLAGLISGIRRLQAYALLSLLLMMTGQLLDVPELIPFLVLGGTILGIGIILLVRFVRKYPISAEAETHGIR